MRKEKTRTLEYSHEEQHHLTTNLSHPQRYSTEISNHLTNWAEPSSPELTEVKSKNAFISDRNNRRSITTGPHYHHYHHYMVVNTSACMTCALRHGSEGQSRDRLLHSSIKHNVNSVQLHKIQTQPGQLKFCSTENANSGLC